MPWYRKFHHCPCGEEWEDEWDCLCNDKCPSCNKEIEPYDWEEMPQLDEPTNDAAVTEDPN